MSEVTHRERRKPNFKEDLLSLVYSQKRQIFIYTSLTHIHPHIEKYLKRRSQKRKTNVYLQNLSIDTRQGQGSEKSVRSAVTISKDRDCVAVLKRPVCLIDCVGGTL